MIYHWWRGLNKLFFSHLKIYLEFWIFIFWLYPYIDMFRLSIGTLTTSKWGTQTHVTQCHIMSRDSHVKFRDSLVTSSSTLFTNLNIWSPKKTFKSQWFLKSSDLFSLFLPKTNCEVCPPGWHINVLSYKFSSQASESLFSRKFNLLVNLRTSVKKMFLNRFPRDWALGHKNHRLTFR